MNNNFILQIIIANNSRTYFIKNILINLRNSNFSLFCFISSNPKIYLRSTFEGTVALPFLQKVNLLKNFYTPSSLHLRRKFSSNCCPLPCRFSCFPSIWRIYMEFLFSAINHRRRRTRIPALFRIRPNRTPCNFLV